jgi:hypothetical protein
MLTKVSNRKTLNEDDHKLLMAARLGHVKRYGWRDEDYRPHDSFRVGDTDVTLRIEWLMRSEYIFNNINDGGFIVNEERVQPNE